MKNLWPDIELPNLIDPCDDMNQIAIEVAQRFNIPVFKLKGKGQAMELVRARRWFAKEAYPKYTLKQIGKFLNRHHSSIHHLLNT